MGYLKLKDTGAHSVGINNNTGKQITRAKPEFVMVNPLTFTVSGGTADSPQVQHAANGLIVPGTELWFRLGGSNDLVKGTVGGVAVSGAGPYTYTLTDIVPALASLPASAFKLRADAAKTMMALAVGTTDEPLCKDTDLSLITGVHARSEVPGTWTNTDIQLDESIILPPGTVLTHVGMKQHAAPGAWTGKLGVFRMDSPTSCTPVAIVDANITPDGTMQYFPLNYVVPANGTYRLGAWSTASQTALYSGTTCTYLGLCPAIAVGELISGMSVAGGGGPVMGYKFSGQITAPDQLITQQDASLLPYFAAGNLSRDITISVGGVDYTVTPDGAVTETGSGPYVTTIPIPAQASAPTAAQLRTRYLTPVDIASVTYAAGPELTVTGVDTDLPDNPALKRLALMLRGDVTTGTPRARAGKIHIKERII
jgi:hypothetical protein